MEIDSFNLTIDQWIDELSYLDIRQLLIKPTETSWSLGQVYEHLIEESNWYNDQIEKTLGNDTNSDKATSETAKVLFRRGSFKDERIQGDPFLAENVKQPISTDQLKSDLMQLKKRTNTLYKKLINTPEGGKSAHPGLGFLNSYEWIQYSEMHMRHHLKQKKRIMLTLGLDGNGDL